MRLRIGTRGSKLALIQAQMVANTIREHFCIECILVPILTTGDRITDKNLYQIGGKGLFLKELEEELLEKNIDLAVHSLKDVPGILPEVFAIAAVLKRGDPRDCFVSFKYKSIDQLPVNAVIGSSSIRRKILLEQKRPDLNIIQFRGNIDTRLDKLKSGMADATILATAGLKRAGLFDQSYCYPISTTEMLPSPGQGVIAIEILKSNLDMIDICRKINHIPTWYISKAERSFLSYLDASCDTPISAYATIDNKIIKSRYMLSGNDMVFYHDETGSQDIAEDLGMNAGRILIKRLESNRTE